MSPETPFQMKSNVIHAPFGRGHEMYAYYAHGFSLAEIGKWFGVSAAITEKMIRRYLASLRPGGRHG